MKVVPLSTWASVFWHIFSPWKTDEMYDGFHGRSRWNYGYTKKSANCVFWIIAVYSWLLIHHPIILGIPQSNELSITLGCAWNGSKPPSLVTKKLLLEKSDVLIQSVRSVCLTQLDASNTFTVPWIPSLIWNPSCDTSLPLMAQQSKMPNKMF